MANLPAAPTEFLAAILEGQRPGPADLDAFVAANPNEGQHLEYKDGKELADPVRKAKATIREQVAWFANAVGGILLVGIAEGHPRTVSPCPPKLGDQSLEHWAASVLSPLMPRLTPPPVVQVIDHPYGPVLLVVVDRATVLVPLLEGVDETYYFCFVDGARKAPAYLVSDLVLGRRQIPALEVWAHLSRTHPDSAVYRPSFLFSVENVGLVTAEQVQLAIACWSLGTESRLSSQLLRHVDFQEPTGLTHRFFRQHRLANPSDRLSPMPPFSRHASPPTTAECEQQRLEPIIGRKPRAAISGTPANL